eukprot:gene10251-13788_t
MYKLSRFFSRANSFPTDVKSFYTKHLTSIQSFSSMPAKTVESDNVATGSVANESKGRRHTSVKVKYNEPVNINDAVGLVKQLSWAKFDESVEVAVNLNLDPRKPNQSIKGVANLPHGTGKKIRVCVFAKGSDATEAIAAGADIVGAEDLIAKIQGGELGFDRVIATPEMMSIVGKIGKILGPRGMMPNPKMGTVTKEITKAVKAARAGAVQFKVEKKGIIHAGIGKVSFPPEMLLENIRSLMVAILDAKPEGFKGKYMQGAHICSTMGPSITLELPSVDPSSPRFMLKLK